MQKNMVSIFLTMKATVFDTYAVDIFYHIVHDQNCHVTTIPVGAEDLCQVGLMICVRI